MISPSLRDLMLRDWGYDLPIAGGRGQSRDDPIVITATNPDVAAFTQMRLLQGLGRGRGIYWRCLGRKLVGEERHGIEQFKIETIELTPTQKITQVENYYFDLSALAHEWRLVEGALHFQRLDLRIPCGIGWLHVDVITDNEPFAPGAGVTVSYGAPAVKATMYIYDWQRADVPEDVTHPIVRSEFERAVNDVKSVVPHIETWPDPPFDGSHLSRYFKIGEDAKENSLLAITTYRRKFLKMRVTWERDAFIDEVATGWVHSVLDWCGRTRKGKQHDAG
jgi:hypothetical protein